MSGVPHRAFLADGRRWEVFEVNLVPAGRRSPRPRQPDDLVVDDRRESEARLRVPAHLGNGWLAFQTDGERRRLAPIPPGWIELQTSGLCILLDSAKRVPEHFDSEIPGGPAFSVAAERQDTDSDLRDSSATAP